jgi:hypothetical protein
MMDTSVLWFFEGGRIQAKNESLLDQRYQYYTSENILTASSNQCQFTRTKSTFVVFNDSGQPYNIPLDSITGEGEPTFHMLSVDPAWVPRGRHDVRLLRIDSLNTAKVKTSGVTEALPR